MASHAPALRTAGTAAVLPSLYESDGARALQPSAPASSAFDASRFFRLSRVVRCLHVGDVAVSGGPCRSVSKPPLGPYAWMLCGCISFALMAEFATHLGRLGCDWRIVALARSGLAFLFALG